MASQSRLEATGRLSQPFHDGDIEKENTKEAAKAGYDVIVVGTGYGGAVAASRLARAKKADGKPLKIAVLERGREFKLGEYPTSISDMPNRVWIDSAAGSVGVEADALFDVRINEGVSVLSGRGLGGTSQINANVAVRPDPRVFQHKAWPSAIRDHPEKLGTYFFLAEEMLQPNPYPSDRREPGKLRALREFHGQLQTNGHGKAEFVTPPLTINFKNEYRHPITGVKQNACTDCGNCIAGCNEGSKSTLSVNYLLDAKEWCVNSEGTSKEGRESLTIFSLCTVTHILPNIEYDSTEIKKEGNSNRRWKIYVRDTAHPTRVGFFRADSIILAGGVIGTTEILLRSQREAIERDIVFETSNLLGRRLSTNADMIGFGYGHQLHGSGERGLNTVNRGSDDEAPGPTITGMIDLRRNNSVEDGIVIQEGATPSAFAWIFDEVIALTTSVHRAIDPKSNKKIRVRQEEDRLLPSEAALQSTQVYLAMGHDKFEGRDFKSGHIELIDDRPRIKWPGPGAHPVYKKQNDILSTCTNTLGGIYIPNPAWQFLPERAAKFIGLQETIVGNQVVTVHPLGGCCMGDDASEGVVDESGRVYSGTTGTSVHAGLMICDGSIMPTSLGINPLLTITALAERSIAQLAKSKGWHIEYGKKASAVKVPERQTVERVKTASSSRTSVEFTESLDGKGFWPPGPSIRARPRFQAWAEERLVRFKVRAKLTVKHDQPDLKNLDQVFRANCIAGEVALEGLTEDLWMRILPRRPQVSNPQERGLNLVVQPYRVREDLTTDKTSRSAVELFSRDGRGSNWFLYFLKREWTRIISSPYLRARTLKLAGDDIERRAWIDASLWRRLPDPWRRAVFRWVTHLKRRGMDYRLWLGETETSRSLLCLVGYKDLEPYWGPDLFEGLTTLQVHFRDPDNGFNRASALLTVRLNDFLRNESNGLWEWGQGYLKSYGNDRIKSLATLASTGAYFARAIAAGYFTGFTEPQYPPPNPFHSPAGRIRRNSNQDGDYVTPDYEWIDVDGSGAPSDDKKTKIRLLLTSYRQLGNSTKGPILLLHGFGASSLTFALDIKGQQNLVQRLFGEGFDVWLLDYRSSIVLSTASNACTLDEVAEFDIPRALDVIWEHYGKVHEVHVLAHCVGAAALMISILSGHAKHIKSVISSQVGFILIGALMNRFKRPVAFFLNRVLQADMVTAYADIGTKPWGKIVDRLLSAYPVPMDEKCESATCHRLTAIYGRIFNHRHVMEKSNDCTHDHLHELFGYANTEMFRQISRCFESMSLCTSDGESAWLRRWRIQRFMTMPILFLHGKDNDVFHPASTYYTSELLSEINPSSRYKHIEFEDYGHQDCIVGTRAADRIFPEMVQFLDEVIHETHSVDPLHVAISPSGKRQLNPPRDEKTTFRLPWEVADIHQKLRKDRAFDVQVPFLGPIVGHTTSNSIRLWIRANEVKPEGMTCIGVACLLDKVTGEHPDPIFERLIETANGDCYCVFTFRNLSPDREYWIEAGTVTHEVETELDPDEIKYALYREIYDAEKIAKEQNVKRSFWAKVKTMSLDDDAKSISFILGSCHHPIDDFGGRENDKLFLELESKLKADDEFNDVRFMLMVGDQIYADPYERIGFRARTASEFSSVYTQAFAPNSAKARIMTRLPTYMILDDHEIEDSWDPTRDSLEHKQLFETAIDAYRCYQASHGPDRDWYRKINEFSRPQTSPRSHRVPKQLWYEFEVSGIPFFVLDTRTEREIRDGYDESRVSENELISFAQLAALRRWLLRDRPTDIPKFIVSASVLAPQTKAPLVRQDSWARFPATCEKALDCISDNKITNVVFLSGDYHCSTVAKIGKTGSKDAVAHSIVASPFHCTVNFVNVQSYDLHHAYHLIENRKYYYEVLSDSSHPTGHKPFILDSQNGRNDNFAKIDVRKNSNGGWRVAITYYLYAGMGPLRERGPRIVIS